MEPQIMNQSGFFKDFTKEKYYKIISACRIFNNHTEEYIYFDIKMKECEIKHVENRIVPVDSVSKELKTVSYYDLIPVGRTKKYVPAIHESRLQENWIMKPYAYMGAEKYSQERAINEAQRKLQEKQLNEILEMDKQLQIIYARHRV